MEKKWTIAIYLTAGKGSRMKTTVQKQYLSIGGQPLMLYGLRQLEKCKGISEIILVVPRGEVEYCQREIIDKYQVNKIKQIVEGGEERSDSVYNALQFVDEKDVDYVLIHDGARPLITQALLNKCLEEVLISKACVLGVPVKDTIKVIDDKGYIVDTPERKSLYAIQTPQVFQTSLIKKAYDAYYINKMPVTDDAMIVEQYTEQKVKIILGEYCNLKVTTPEDLKLVETYLKGE